MICLCFSGEAEWSASAVDDSNGMFDLVVDLCCLHDCSGAGTCEAKRLAVFDEHGMFDLVVGRVSICLAVSGLLTGHVSPTQNSGSLAGTVDYSNGLLDLVVDLG